MLTCFEGYSLSGGAARAAMRELYHGAAAEDKGEMVKL